MNLIDGGQMLMHMPNPVVCVWLSINLRRKIAFDPAQPTTRKWASAIASRIPQNDDSQIEKTCS